MIVRGKRVLDAFLKVFPNLRLEIAFVNSNSSTGVLLYRILGSTADGRMDVMNFGHDERFNLIGNLILKSFGFR